jgi:hypothetical protein
MKDFSNTAKINRWGRKFVFPHDASEPKISGLRLMHRTANGKQTEVQSFEIDAKIDDDGWKGVIEEINSSIQDDAEGAGGVQNYIVFADREPGEPLSRLQIRCHILDEDDEDSVSSEPATSKGILAMLMRHVEAKERNMTTYMASMSRQNQVTLEQLTTMVERFGEKHVELVMRTESLLSQQNERELAGATAQADIENRQMMVQRFVGLLAPLAKKFLGGSASPEDNPEVMEMKDFLHGLDENEIEHLKMGLSPDKVMILMSLMEKHHPDNPNNKLAKNGQGRAKEPPTT